MTLKERVQEALSNAYANGETFKGWAAKLVTWALESASCTRSSFSLSGGGSMARPLPLVRPRTPWL